MPRLHREIHFKSAICRHLWEQSWLSAEGEAAHCDSQSALFIPKGLAGRVLKCPSAPNQGTPVAAHLHLALAGGGVYRSFFGFIRS
jgi:hypothetical protein